MNKAVLGAVALCMLASCSNSKIEKAQELVRLRLSDPDSAQFKNAAVSSRNQNVVCGEVNSKNRFGGYVGFKRYFVDVETQLMEIESEETLTPAAREMFGNLVVDSAKFDELYRQKCER